MTLKHGQKSEKKKEIDVENQTGIKIAHMYSGL